MQLHHTDSIYRRSPLVQCLDNTPFLYVIEWQENSESLVEYQIAPTSLKLSERRVVTTSKAIVGIESDGVGSPRITPDPACEMRATTPEWQVTVQQEGVRSIVRVTTPDNKTYTVWNARGIAAAPTIKQAKDGAWVAFHHNVREDTNEPDVAKWIALRFIDRKGNVFEPSAEMLDRNRDADGEEQSFEFPSLVNTQQGGIVLFGRGSHGYWFQSLDEEGWSKRSQLREDNTWGARGRRVSVTTLEDGTILTATRERKGIELATLVVPTNGRPKLRTATIKIGNDSPITIENHRKINSDYLTLYGDLQQHSAHSDGIGSAWEAYLRARDHYHDDFCALTDHESFLGKRIGPGEWEYLQKVAEACTTNQFISIIAYEWTGKMYPGPGHKVVYLPDTGYKIISRDEIPEGKALVEKVHQQGAITGPHHIGWTGANLEGHTDHGQPIWEICSCHGCYEHKSHPLGYRGNLDDQMVDVALKKGMRFGFIASSDSHGLLWHHGECRKRDPFRTGLTAVQVKERSRSAIFNALKQRRCYATSGVKIHLDFGANAYPMGSTIPLTAIPHEGKTSYEAKCEGTAKVKRLVLVGPNGIVAESQGNGRVAQVQWKGRIPYLYARVEQEDGEMAWSSPIFWNSA